LRFGHHISNLPVTTDYDWNPRKPRGGHKGQVHVEIEGVCNLNVVPSEVTRQIEPGNDRLPTIQLSAQSKLGNFGEVGAERPTVLRTSEMEAKRGCVDVLSENRKLAFRTPHFEVSYHQE
jgi:hypothetical protein